MTLRVGSLGVCKRELRDERRVVDASRAQARVNLRLLCRCGDVVDACYACGLLRVKSWTVVAYGAKVLYGRQKGEYGGCAIERRRRHLVCFVLLVPKVLEGCIRPAIRDLGGWHCLAQPLGVFSYRLR